MGNNGSPTSLTPPPPPPSRINFPTECSSHQKHPKREGGGRGGKEEGNSHGMLCLLLLLSLGCWWYRKHSSVGIQVITVVTFVIVGLGAMAGEEEEW